MKTKLTIEITGEGIQFTNDIYRMLDDVVEQDEDIKDCIIKQVVDIGTDQADESYVRLIVNGINDDEFKDVVIDNINKKL